MPGEQPQGAPALARNGDWQPCQVASGPGHHCQPPCKDHSPASRPAKGTREAGCRTQAVEPREAHLRQAQVGAPKASLLRTQALGSGPGKGDGTQEPPLRSPSQAHMRLVGGVASSPPQTYSLSIASSRSKPALNKAPEGQQPEATQLPEAETSRGPGPEAPLRPSVPRAEAQPELSFQRCFREAPSSFTSINHTSANTTPRPPTLRAPPSRGASPLRPASYPQFPASGANSWPLAAENSFPGANFGVPPTEPEPFPEGSGPGGSPKGVSFPFSFPALHRAGTKPFPADSAGQKYADGMLVFTFHQAPGAWPGEAVGIGPAYPPATPALPALPCYPGQPGSLNPSRDLSSALSAPGVTHPAPIPFSDNLHKSLTKVLPDRPPSAQDGLGSPRGPLNPRPQRCFPGQARGTRVDTSPGPLDTELATPGPSPTRLPPLWDPTAAPYPTLPLGPPATTQNTFFESQPSPTQQLCLPQSPPLPWAQVLPTAGPNPHQMDVQNRLPFPTAAPEWQGYSQGALGTTGRTPGPGDKLAAMSSSPGQLFTYSGPKDPGAQPLFFRVAQPQLSPQGTPSLPPARVVGASPSESPLPSPATNAAGSTCSSLSPLSSSPANPSSEESQLPGPLGPPAFFHSSPEPPHAHPTHYQPEPAKVFPFPTDRLGVEGAFQALEEAPLPREPSPCSAHHLSLSSASLAQLDVLLTCRQCDRNYSSLAAFLAHRQFCSLLLARARDSHQQPQGPPGLPSPLNTPKAAADTHPGLLSHSKTSPFLSSGDIQEEGKDDSLRMSFLPSLATTPLPLPTTDLDMEDDAKLDSLITEALNGMEHQPDSPDIDSSFIDVFADEEPSGPRGLGAGKLPKTRVGMTPENRTQAPLAAATLEPQAPRPGDGGRPAQSRPKTRSLGLTPTETEATSLVRHQRRGKQLKLFQKDLDTANTTKGPDGGARATCLRPRRKGSQAEWPRHCAQDLRTQAPKDSTEPDTQVPRATPLAEETRSSRHARRRKAGAGTWSKELIHKIVQQKNRLQRQAQPSGRRGSLVAKAPQPSTEDRLRKCKDASDSEDELLQQRDCGSRGRPRRSCRRWHQQGKRKDLGLAQGTSEDKEVPEPRKVGMQGDHGCPPSPEQPHMPSLGPPPSPEAEERGPQHADHPMAAPKQPLQIPPDTKTPEENHPQRAKKPGIAEESPPNTIELREGLSAPPATCVKDSLRPPPPEQPQSDREDSSPKPSGSLPDTMSQGRSPTSAADGLVRAVGDMRPPVPCVKEDSSAHQPGEFLGSVASAVSAAHPEPSILFSKNSDGGGSPAHVNRLSMGVLVAKKGPHPCSGFLGPKDLAGCFPDDLYSTPAAVDTSAAGSPYLCDDSADTCSLKPKPPKNSPYTVETDPGKATSPLTLESTSLFLGLPMDRFGPPLYDSLSAHRDPHVPFAGAGPPQEKSQVNAQYPTILLLEEVSPVLPSHFSDLAEGKAFRKQGPGVGTVVPSPPSLLPGKGSECSSTFMSHLSEDELEIQRLVTELESQLRRSEGTHRAPGAGGEAERVGKVGLGTSTEPSSSLPTHQTTLTPRDTCSAADLTGVGESSSHGEGAKPSVVTTEGALRRPPGQWPRPALFTQEDLVSVALFGPVEASCSFQLVQKARVPEVAGEGTPSPAKQLEPLPSAKSSARCSPNPDLPFPKNKEIVGTQEGEGTLLPCPCDQRRLFPESHKAGRSHKENPTSEPFSGPNACLPSDLLFRDDGALHLDVIWPPGAHCSEATLGPSGGRTGGSGRVLHSIVEGPGSEGREFAPAGASSRMAPPDREAQLVPVPSPTCVPNTGPSGRLQGPTSTPQLQSVGAEAAGSKNDTQGSKGPPPADPPRPQGEDSPSLEGHNAKGRNTAHSPAKGSPGREEMMAGHQADGHLGLLSQTEEPKGQGQASQLQSDDPTLGAGPETTPARPTRRAALQGAVLKRRRAASGLQYKSQTTPSPPCPGAVSLKQACTEAYTQDGPEDQSLEKVTTPGPNMQVPLTGTSLATCAPSHTTPATPIPCNLKHLPQQDPPTWTSTEAQGEWRGLFPPSPPSGEPLGPGHLTASLGETDCVQAPTDAGAGGPPEAAPSLMTQPCDPKEVLVRCPLLEDSSPLGDPPSQQPGFVSISGDSTLSTLEDSRKKRPGVSPAHNTPPPPIGTVSPRVTSLLAKDETEAARALRVPDPPCSIAPAPTSPDGLPSSSSPPSPSNSACLSCREGQGARPVPADPTIVGASGPDDHTCPEDEVGASSQGQQDLGAPEVGCSGISEASPIVPCPPEGLCPGRATSPSRMASDFRPHSPANNRNTPNQTAQEEPLGLQALEQKAHGLKKKPMSTEHGLWRGQAPGTLPMTCEFCMASFRSRPGLTRHKARKHQLPEGNSPPSPTVQPCWTSRRKSQKAPGKDGLHHSITSPSHTTEPPPDQGSRVRTPGFPPNQKPHSLGLGERGMRGKPPASRSRRPDQPEPGKLYRRQADKREGQRRLREPAGSLSNLAKTSRKKGGKLEPRRLGETAPPDLVPDGPCSSPAAAVSSHPAPPSCCLPPEGGPTAAPGPREIEAATEKGARALCAEGMPGDPEMCQRRTEEASAGEWSTEHKGTLARRPWGPREARALACREPPQATKSQPAKDSRGAESSPGEGAWEGHVPSPSPPGAPETCSSEASLLDNPTVQSGDQRPGGSTPEAPSLGLKDPLSLFDDEVSFSQLFPLGGRLTGKKNPRVYGKRSEKPKRPTVPKPSSEARSGSPPCCAHLSTDLSDSGSLCLSHEDPWEDEATGLPESFLLDGLLSSKVPGIDRWAPGLSLWALEPNSEASTEKVLPLHPEDDHPETIPKLHMVPAAWRGPELQVPTDDTPLTLGDASPEPPNLERERYDGHPGNTSLLPLPAMDFGVLGTKFEVQDLCFLGPFEDPEGLSGTNFFNFEATAKSQDQMTEEAAGQRRAQGRVPPAKGKRASYKCRACFQRFSGLGELDLHKLAHSPAPPPTCYMCVERTFGSSQLLREHLQEKHLQGKAGPWACGMCLKEVADVWMYNQHLREHAVRFARKGQVQRSLGGLPSCLEDGSAFSHFLNSVPEPACKPHRGKRSAGKAHGTPGEPSRGAGKDSRREKAKAGGRSSSAPSGPDGASTPGRVLACASAESCSPAACAHPALASNSATSPDPAKTSPSLSPDPWSGSESLLQAIPVHEDCKDPSRDCHHCGKRFPKPFKLQRHLAVHSPQRVYLCPRCPRVYPEHRELLAHLDGAHGVREKPELQHTPLYACELCATVMRIIKKSFACSACNYTFAKKEQFDRHMDKHLGRGQQPLTFRGVRRPGALGQKAPALEGVLPSKRRRVAVPGSPLGPCMDRPLPQSSSPARSEESHLVLLQLCPQAAPSTTEGPPNTPERPVDLAGHVGTRCNLPPDPQEHLPPSQSPFPAALADGRGAHKLDPALRRPEDKASPGSPGPFVQPTILSGPSLPHPSTRGQGAEEKGAPLLLSGKRRTPGTRGKCAPESSQEDPSVLQKQMATCHLVPDVGTGGPSHKSNATKPGGCRSSSKNRSGASTPSQAPKLPLQPRRAVGNLEPGELACSTENRTKATTPKDRPGPSSQGSGGPRPGTKIGGGSQPHPASGQLQSETATTPAKPDVPSQSPTPDKTPPRAQAKGYTKGPRGGGDQGPQWSPGPREKGVGSEKRRKGQIPGPISSDNTDNLGRVPPAPNRPLRAPRKQATPSRVPPAKPRPSGQTSKQKPQPSEPGHPHRRDVQGKTFPQARPLLRPPRRGRAVHGAEPADHDYRTAEAQSDLLSQLFGQRLTGFKIPLKKDISE
ncbi:zinc finger protein 469 [Nycticebus coucang]|uniref:zinc finger protein 469 n=1 Tax=Nycticebus coucang TaxID=9470 RepID=UPI00234C6125|nr:zinc finger protein 469 [Nycticebus coucang]